MGLHDAQLMSDQEKLDKIVDQITGGLPEYDRAKIPGFSEVEVDAAHRHLRLHWKGEVPASVAKVLAHLPAGFSAEVVPAKYSKAELHAARDKLLSNGQQKDLASKVTPAATRITSVAPAVDGSGLDVTYDEDRGQGRFDVRDSLAPSVRQDKTSEVEAAAESLTGVQAHVRYQALSIDAQATREADWSPWQGGGGLQTGGGTICSTGFGVTRKSDGKKLITTAYHCGAQGPYYTWSGSHAFVGTAKLENASATNDIVGIDPGKNTSGNRVWDGPWNMTGYSKAVSGWGNNNVGDMVCTSAANSGAHCWLYIQQTDISVTGPNGVTRPDVEFAYSDDIAAANGDSGGPVFTGSNDWTTDEARGVITALDNTMDCGSFTTADAWQRKPWCFHGVYYVPIGKILHDQNWSLNTG
ncbi:S1 family peptidase [Kitasatospora sp. RB6PN24]|uniref:S1 family peptidase n=1 Tax=Kitasatospora humi TaxID=2893891 RepID=UPI001E377411|nr:S1 family peptidase [Kitasatospora humi]MCC9307204.1 S1 family peptidase [Kitasatospora humi]